MATIMQSREARHNILFEVSSGSGAVLAPIAIVLTLAVGAAVALPHGLFLPAIALAVTIVAAVTGAIGWFSAGKVRANWLTATGIFALAAVAASMLGDPDQVALFLK
jgi:hypothetical protein